MAEEAEQGGVDLVRVGPGDGVRAALHHDEVHVRDQAGQSLPGLVERQDPVGVTLNDQYLDVDLRQAPIKSTPTHLAGTGDASRKIALYHGVTNADALYEHDWLQQFEGDHPWFAYRPALSPRALAGPDAAACPTCSRRTTRARPVTSPTSAGDQALSPTR